MHFLSFLSVFLLWQGLQGQTLTGTLQGGNSNALEGCQVHLHVLDTGTISDNAGHFEIGNLPTATRPVLNPSASMGPFIRGGHLFLNPKSDFTGEIEILSAEGKIIAEIPHTRENSGFPIVDLKPHVPNNYYNRMLMVRVREGKNEFSLRVPPGSWSSSSRSGDISPVASKKGTTSGRAVDTLSIYCQGHVAQRYPLDSYERDFGTLPFRSSPNILFAIADDASFHMSAYNNNGFLDTPNFDKVASEGILMNNVFVPNPKCAPCRAATLTSRNSWQLEEAGNHFGNFPAKFKIYTKILRDAGYFVGHSRKGWGPGTWQGDEWNNPAGPKFNNFDDFLDARPANQPFCFWWGSNDPHRGYPWQSGVGSGKSLNDVTVPDYYPDVDTIRHDILDYAVEVERFDTQMGELLASLESEGETNNTVIIATSDHGYPFPRGKGQLYDEGIHVPMSIRWGDVVEAGRTVDDFVSFIDLGPTYLDLAGVPPEPTFTGYSFLDVLTTQTSGQVNPARSFILAGKERHDAKRTDPDSGNEDVGYPVRAMRTSKYLYLRNYKPDRWLAGDPPCYNNIDSSPTKTWLIDHKDEPENAVYFEWAMGKRPAEELYDVEEDPHNVNNLADQPAFASIRDSLREAMEEVLTAQGDPRMAGEGDVFDNYPHFINPNTCAVPARLQ